MLNQESFCCPGLAKPNSEPIPKLISQTRLETHNKIDPQNCIHATKVQQKDQFFVLT